MHYIYRILCITNNKNYIGQASEPRVRWNQHKLEARKEFPTMIINRAMKKHGIENFKFEVIACCATLDDANIIETLCVDQYNSHIRFKKGYNVALGGSNAPKTEEWKKQISKLAKERAPITSQQMKEIAANRPDDYYDIHKGNQYRLGTTQSEEWKEMMHNREHSEEERQKRSESLKASYAAGERTSYFREHEPWNKGIPMTEKQKEILRQSHLGKVSPKKILFSDEETNKICADSRSCKEIAEDYDVSLDVIWRLKKTHGVNRSVQEANLIKNISGENNPFFGKSHSEAAKEANRLAHLGKCKFSSEQIQEMKQMFNNNKTMADIARVFNCSAPTIKRMLNK